MGLSGKRVNDGSDKNGLPNLPETSEFRCPFIHFGRVYEHYHNLIKSGNSSCEVKLGMPDKRSDRFILNKGEW